jgi:hypothetical protein
VIKHYREIEVLDGEWSADSLVIINNIRRIIAKEVSLPEGASWLPIHVIDLHKIGYIDRHVDSVKFSGGFVCGLSLLCPAIMTLTPEGASGPLPLPGPPPRFLMPPNSLYVMRGDARYKYAHAVRSPADGEQVWKGREIGSERRISLMFRDEKTQ